MAEHDREAVAAATAAALEAARSLTESDDADAKTMRRLARDLDKACQGERFDSQRAFDAGPHATWIDLTGVPHRLSLVEMLVRDPGPDPVRTAALLLRAIQWDAR